VQQLDPIYVDVSQSSGEWLALKQDIVAGRLKAGGAGTPAKILLEMAATTVRKARCSSRTSPSMKRPEPAAARPGAKPDTHAAPGHVRQAIISQGVRADALLAPQIGLTRDATGQATALVVARATRSSHARCGLARDRRSVAGGGRPPSRRSRDRRGPAEMCEAREVASAGRRQRTAHDPTQRRGDQLQLVLPPATCAMSGSVAAPRKSG